MNKCLICYQTLDNSTVDFHSSCAKKLFGSTEAPILDFELNQLEDLAKQFVIQNKSVTGVQAKISLHIEKTQQAPARFTLVGLHGDYILKPPSDYFEALPENEDLTMHLAAMVKIKTAQHALIRLKSGELAYITKRFDRDKKNKLAVEDFCQLSENLTEHKYRGSVEKIGKLTQTFTTNKGYEAQRLFELVLFCFLTGNADMHLKNYSIIENTLGGFDLSPAYDLVNTTIAMPEDKEESALTINARKSKLKRKDFDLLATSFKLNEKALQSIYQRFENSLDPWLQFVNQSFLPKHLKTDYSDLLKSRHMRIFNEMT
jgi:serine/threonine-protein kinase HipA